MQTRKDLLQAHRLMTMRASQALILGEPDDPEIPLRRINVAAFAGMCVAILVAAGFGIFGLIKPGGAKAIEKGGMVLIEKESGARYVWCDNKPGQRLCPVANYSSAKLLSDSGSQKNVSRNSLAKYTRGPMIGVPGLPDTIPSAKQLVKMPWSACVRTADTQNEGRVPIVTLMAGREPGGTTLRDDQALVVKDNGEGGQPWLLWRNQRLKINPPDAADQMTPNPPVVAGKWLNAVQAGPDYAAPAIPERGAKAQGPDGSNKRVGVVYSVRGGASYVLLSDGLSAITEVERDLLLRHPDTKSKAYDGATPTAYPIDAATVGQAEKSQRTVSTRNLPPTRPSMVPYTDSTPLCAVYRDASGKTGGKLAMGGELPAPPNGTNQQHPDDADQLSFPPGRAALAGVLPTVGKPETVSNYFLITEDRRFAIASPEAAGKLDYNLGENAVRVPAALVELISEGPKLDPALANLPVTPPAPQQG